MYVDLLKLNPQAFVARPCSLVQLWPLDGHRSLRSCCSTRGLSPWIQRGEPSSPAARCSRLLGKGSSVCDSEIHHCPFHHWTPADLLKLKHVCLMLPLKRRSNNLILLPNCFWDFMQFASSERTLGDAVEQKLEGNCEGSHKPHHCGTGVTSNDQLHCLNPISCIFQIRNRKNDLLRNQLKNERSEDWSSLQRKLQGPHISDAESQGRWLPSPVPLQCDQLPLGSALNGKWCCLPNQVATNNSPLKLKYKFEATEANAVVTKQSSCLGILPVLPVIRITIQSTVFPEVAVMSALDVSKRQCRYCSTVPFSGSYTQMSLDVYIPVFPSQAQKPFPSGIFREQVGCDTGHRGTTQSAVDLLTHSCRDCHGSGHLETADSFLPCFLAFVFILNIKWYF
ncbi:hypothetical protein IHE44_0012002 [Lamprotornis superbus]|uniref:Uncharacterized protein n=1 Tax=Lamprotornis superbus TaxID=245042 RepID=A0A835TZW1_9PASS|nr:hypothetical protein IHE44_0012002 [Lamprotornis superbus]